MNIEEELKHPQESKEFLEHMLDQTKRVERLNKCLKKIGWVTGTVATIFFAFSFIQYCSTFVQKAQLVSFL